jgi:hypothetical protein
VESLSAFRFEDQSLTAVTEVIAVCCSNGNKHCCGQHTEISQLSSQAVHIVTSVTATLPDMAVPHIVSQFPSSECHLTGARPGASVKAIAVMATCVAAGTF